MDVQFRDNRARTARWTICVPPQRTYTKQREVLSSGDQPRCQSTWCVILRAGSLSLILYSICCTKLDLRLRLVLVKCTDMVRTKFELHLRLLSLSTLRKYRCRIRFRSGTYLSLYFFDQSCFRYSADHCKPSVLHRYHVQALSWQAPYRAVHLPDRSC